MYQSFKMALKSIAGNKMRSFLTILGVVIGVVSIVVLVAIAQGTNASVISSIEGMGTNLITANIRARRSTTKVTLEDLNTLAKDESIQGIAPLTNVSGTVKAGVTTYEDGSIMGTTPSYGEIRGWTLAKGRFLQQPDIDNRSFVAILGKEAAEEMYGTDNVVGEMFTINGYSFTVVGILDEIGSSSMGSGDNQIVIPFTLAERVSSQPGISTFYVSAVSADEVPYAQQAVTNYLSSIFSTSSQYSLYNQSEMLESLSETTRSLTLMLGGIAAISLLVGGIGIMNIMLVSVSERTKEIGIRKAIGAARTNILMQFLIEALVVSAMGGLLGLGISIGACYFLESALEMTMTISSSVALLAIGFSVVIGVIFGLYPANKASKLKPIEALHYEG